MAWSLTDRFDIPYFVLTLVGALCLHAGANVINDYFDYRSGCDQANKDAIRPFTGGAPFLVQGILSPRAVLTYALGLFAVAGSIGAYLALVRGWFIFALAIFGILSGYLYTTNLATRSIGEFFVGLNFGPLLTLGAYYVQTQTLAVEPFVAALPLGLLVAAILWINEIPDYNADRLVGKNTSVVRLGRRKAAKVYAYIIGATYAIIVAGVAFRVLPATALLTLLSLHLAVKAVKVAGKYYESQELRPANALTILTHLMVGLLMTGAYILQRLLTLL